MSEQGPNETKMKEDTIEEFFAKLLTDESSHDVTLRCSDGVHVEANRVALCRCAYFKTMLKGGFSEASSSAVDVVFPGDIVNAIVQYIHTNNADLLVIMDHVIMMGDESTIAVKEDSDARPVQQFLSILSLLEASDFFQLTGLCDKARQYLAACMKKFPILSIYLLEASCAHVPVELEAQTFSCIRSNNYEMLDVSILGSISSEVLEKIILDGKLATEESKLFEVISLWSTSGADHTEDRKPIAQKLVEEHIDLQLIDGDMLSMSVHKSGLVSDEQLTMAYQQQAKRAKQDGGKNSGKDEEKAEGREAETVEGEMPTDEALQKWVRAYVSCHNMNICNTRHALEMARNKFGVDMRPKRTTIRSFFVMPEVETVEGEMPTDEALRKWVRAYVTCHNMNICTTRHALEVARSKFGVDMRPKKTTIKLFLIMEV